MELWKALDWFFVVFHTSLIFFNMFGWIWRKTLRWNLVVLVLTGASWVILGMFYGFGYCPLTEWHFQVLRKLGVYDLPGSYIKYLIDRIFLINVESNLVDTITLVIYLMLLTVSIVLNINMNKSNPLALLRKFYKYHCD